MNIENITLKNDDYNKYLTTTLMTSLLGGNSPTLGSSNSNSSFSVVLQALCTAMSVSNDNSLNSNLPGLNLNNLPYMGLKISDYSDVSGGINNYYSSKLSQAYGKYNNNVERVVVKNPKILNAINIACEKYGVDPKLVTSVIKQESDFNPNSVSSAGAMGLMQLMPENCKEYNVSNPYDIDENIDAGVRHLRDMIKSQKGNVILGLAAYNAGPGTLRRRDVTTIDDIYKLPAETRDYVVKVSKYYKSLNI
ncbi:Transglycosylase SLT domain-containing protein [Hathewaya proteolytica DSM 3090]|uniref:Transglycosylase SLT domain-containing protein n=1 Tax=Hathewaya proteolytica DSM 3090 TaxID=1121331 RepID=A0A1M6Q852_9CLOT|nr:lytic transglycosylase domain-containing protein [Hathewaya proteolytica]SHK16305.1 Transglycosylase SLT domain-containing protein [Hathewaya proteolytica DSM 3090]